MREWLRSLRRALSPAHPIFTWEMKAHDRPPVWRIEGLAIAIADSAMLPLMCCMVVLLAEPPYSLFLYSGVTLIAQTALEHVWLILVLIYSSSLIAVERERGTWELLCMTPMPRVEMVTAKVAAMFYRLRGTLAMLYLVELATLFLLGLGLARVGIGYSGGLIGSAAWACCALYYLVKPLLDGLGTAGIGLLASGTVPGRNRAMLAAIMMYAVTMLGHGMLYYLARYGLYGVVTEDTREAIRLAVGAPPFGSWAWAGMLTGHTPQVTLEAIGLALSGHLAWTLVLFAGAVRLTLYMP